MRSPWCGRTHRTMWMTVSFVSLMLEPRRPNETSLFALIICLLASTSQQGYALFPSLLSLRYRIWKTSKFEYPNHWIPNNRLWMTSEDMNVDNIEQSMWQQGLEYRSWSLLRINRFWVFSGITELFGKNLYHSKDFFRTLGLKTKREEMFKSRTNIVFFIVEEMMNVYLYSTRKITPIDMLQFY